MAKAAPTQLGDFQVTANQLQQFAPVAADQLQAIVSAINETMVKYGINLKPRRVRYFVAQAAHETAYFTKWVESLYYSTPERLVEVWPTRFTMDRAKVGTHAVNPKTGKPYPQALAYAPDYTKNEAKLANLVYADREGNGNEASGDGIRFRGRGAFHLTFANNYRAFGHDAYGDGDKFIKAPESVNQDPYRFMSAGWFWNRNNLNGLADSDSFTQSTQVINGSTATVPVRLQVLNKANSIFTWEV